MSSGNDEAFRQPKEDMESQNVRLQEMGDAGIVIRHVLSLKQLKSLEILKSALNIFASNAKFAFLMLLSTLPLIVFMVFYDIKLQKSIISASLNSLFEYQTPRYLFMASLPDDYSSYINKRREFFSDALQLLLFYLFLYPLLEFLSLSITMKIAAKIQAADKHTTFRELLFQKAIFKGPFITYLCVHLLSFLTLLGLFWIVVWHRQLFPRPQFTYLDFGYPLIDAFHLVMFLALLFKYIGWTAFWNMGLVISFTEEQTGIAAFGWSEYYGKHCKKLGFQLMLGFFVFGNVLRLPCLYAGLCDGSVAGVLITSIVIISVGIGNLVKWVAFLLYFEYCKQQTMEKKVDDQELGKTMKAVGDQS